MTDTIIAGCIFVTGVAATLYLIRGLSLPCRSAPFGGIITTTPKGDLGGKSVVSEELKK